MIILALIILVAAVIVGVAGVLHNAGSAHALTHSFSVFGYHVTGSTGTLFLCGIVVGIVAALGLGLLLASARRTSRRGNAARRSLKESRLETAVAGRDRDDLIDQRDDLIDQREAVRAQAAEDQQKTAQAQQKTARAQQKTARAQQKNDSAQQKNDLAAEDREHSAGGAH
jgi:MFS superfamily sulfate permease-like transporter